SELAPRRVSGTAVRRTAAIRRLPAGRVGGGRGRGTVARIGGGPRRSAGARRRGCSRGSGRGSAGSAVVRAREHLVEIIIAHRQVRLAVPGRPGRQRVLHQARAGGHLLEAIAAIVAPLPAPGDRYRHAGRGIDELRDARPVDLLVQLLQILALIASQGGGEKRASFLLPGSF